MLVGTEAHVFVWRQAVVCAVVKAGGGLEPLESPLRSGELPAEVGSAQVESTYEWRGNSGLSTLLRSVVM